MFEFGTIGIEEMPDGLRAYFEDSTDAATIRPSLIGRSYQIDTNLPPVEVLEANDREPILIGNRFVLVPGYRIVLPIDAAMAFGSGRHETTQLCLEALEGFLKPGDTVFDVGCGSGILSLAALKLGAAHVVGADIDEAAVTVARRHFPGPLFVGSADCLPRHPADIAIANITAAVNDLLAFELNRITKPGGLLILSGFTTQTTPSHFEPQHTLIRGDWACWLCNPDHVTGNPLAGSGYSHNASWWL